MRLRTAATRGLRPRASRWPRLAGQAYNPELGFATVANVGAGLKYPYKPFYGGLSPRISLAWNPSFNGGLLGAVFGGNKSVIRGGWARLYGRLNGVDLVLVPLLGTGLGQPVTCLGAPSNFHGLTASANFIWSRAFGTGQVDQSTSEYSVTDPWNMHAMYGPQNNDTPLNYNLFFVYEPGSKTQHGLLGHLANGWSFAPILTWNNGGWAIVNNDGDCASFGETDCNAGGTNEAAVKIVGYTGGSSVSHGVSQAAGSSVGFRSDPGHKGTGMNRFGSNAPSHLQRVPAHRPRTRHYRSVRLHSRTRPLERGLLGDQGLGSVGVVWDRDQRPGFQCLQPLCSPRL